MWRSVTTLSKPKMRRMGIISVSTIANPEKMAPATKYGGKIVECQPGSCDGEVAGDHAVHREHQRRRQAGQQAIDDPIVAQVLGRAAPAQREHAVDDLLPALR